jgi:hypothetical protein
MNAGMERSVIGGRKQRNDRKERQLKNKDRSGMEL